MMEVKEVPDKTRWLGAACVTCVAHTASASHLGLEQFERLTYRAFNSLRGVTGLNELPVGVVSGK